jgi:hypothetical protein
VITTPTDVVMVMEYAGEELFNYIVDTGKGGVGPNPWIQLTHRWSKRMRADCSNK